MLTCLRTALLATDMTAQKYVYGLPQQGKADPRAAPLSVLAEAQVANVGDTLLPLALALYGIEQPADDDQATQDEQAQAVEACKVKLVQALDAEYEAAHRDAVAGLVCAASDADNRPG